MEWLAHLRRMTDYYWRSAQTATDPETRLHFALAAGDHEELAIVCNSPQADAICPAAPDHPLRSKCRRAMTGSCRVVRAAHAEDAAPPADNPG